MGVKNNDYVYYWILDSSYVFVPIVLQFEFVLQMLIKVCNVQQMIVHIVCLVLKNDWGK